MAASAMLVASLLLAAATPVMATSPSADQPAQPMRRALSAGQWAQLKAELNATSLPRSVSVEDGVRTITYTLETGSMLVLNEPAGKSNNLRPQLSVGGCGLLTLCVWLNRGDQLVLAAGGTAFLVGVICAASAGLACLVAGVAMAMAFQWISNRGYICSHYLVVVLLPTPGAIKSCY
jgi:hypothetical protein